MSYPVVLINTLAGKRITSCSPGQTYGNGFFGPTREIIGEEFGYFTDDIEIDQTDNIDHYIATARGEPVAGVVVVTRG